MDRRRNSWINSEEPPLSRLFIIGPKSLTEEDYRKNFKKFGTIEELRMIKDRTTGEYKGVTYIKFSKTSEAATALEELNGTSLVPGTRRLKIMIASSRDQGSKRETNEEEEKAHRLFVVCPKNMNDDQLYDYFKGFGVLEYASIIKDKSTKESKGIAYVKFQKFSDAARAYEECERKYKPVFAEPKRSDIRKHESRNYRGNFSGDDRGGGIGDFRNLNPPAAPLSGNMNDPFVKLTVIASPDLNHDQLWKLFDIIPGMDYCQIRYEGGNSRPSRAIGEVVYTNPQWAAHAKEKLHGFEYPPGFRLIVKPEYTGRVEGTKQTNNLLHSVAETLAQATNLIQAAGLNPANLLNLSNSNNPGVVCNITLPDVQPLSHIDDEIVARCFIVCSPHPLPNVIIRDVFCRFGNLIEAYILSNKTFGYAKYSDRKSAETAIKTLHGAEVNGVRLKVLPAEEQRKRQKIDNSE